jgi:hypothetical protein
VLPSRELVTGPYAVGGGIHILITSTWAEWTTAAATAALALFAGFALRQLGEARDDRHARMIVEIGNRWDSALMLKARRNSVRRQSRLAAMAGMPTTTLQGQEFLALLRVPNFFEDIALLVKKGGLDVELVALGLKAVIEDEWTRWEPAIDVMHADDPLAYAQFRWLRDEMQKQPDV